VQTKKKIRGVYERFPGQWWVRFADAGGKIRREKAGTWSMARDLYHKRKLEALQGKKLPETLRRASTTMGQLLDDALAHSKAHKRSYGTDVPRFKLLKEWFGSHSADDLTPREIEKQLARAAETEEWAPSTFNHYRSLMSLAYRLAIQNRKATTNPARSVPHRREDNNRVRFLTDAEEKKLRKVLKAKWPQHIPELDLALNTGLRKGSMYALTWEMVELKGSMLHVPRTKNEEPLHIPLNQAAIAALKVVRGKRKGNEFVFQSARTGDQLMNSRHWFDDAVEEAGIKDFVWHDLRHTFCSRLRMKGVDLATIAELVGHKSLAMTRRYAHLAPSKLHQVVSLLGSTDTTTDTGTKGALRKSL
jgi:integrase